MQLKMIEMSGIDKQNSGSPQRLPFSVLLVDDNELLLKGIKRFLERDFDQVTAVPTGGEALLRIRYDNYQAVILDLNLPDMSGCEVLEQIRKDSPESVVVIITSDDNDRTRDEVFRKGAFAFLAKPFDIAQLRDLLARACNNTGDKREAVLPG